MTERGWILVHPDEGVDWTSFVHGSAPPPSMMDGLHEGWEWREAEISVSFGESKPTDRPGPPYDAAYEQNRKRR